MAGFAHLTEAAVTKADQIFFREFVSHKDLRDKHIKHRCGKDNCRSRDTHDRHISKVSNQRHITGLRWDAMCNNIRPEGANGGRRQVIGIDRHAAGEDQEIGTFVQELPGSRDNHVQVIVTYCDAKDLRRISLHLGADNRFEFILDSAGIDF